MFLLHGSRRPPNVIKKGIEYHCEVLLYNIYIQSYSTSAVHISYILATPRLQIINYSATFPHRSALYIYMLVHDTIYIYRLVYTVPKNYHNLKIKTEPVMSRAYATVNIQFCSHMYCIQYMYIWFCPKTKPCTVASAPAITGLVLVRRFR